MTRTSSEVASEPTTSGHVEADGRPSVTSVAYRRYVLGLLTVIYVVNYLDRQILGILIEPIKRDMQLSDTQLGLLSGTAFAVCYIVFGLILGALADVVSRRNVIAACLAAWSIATAACGLTQNFVQLFVARMAVGVGEAGCVPPSQSLISAYFPVEQRARALSVFIAGTSLGTCLGYLIGGWLNVWFDWRTAFVVVGLPGLVLALLLMLTVREPQRPTSSARSTRGLFAGMKVQSIVLWRSRSFRSVAVSAGAAAMITYGLGTWLASYFIRYFGLNTGQVGMLLAVVFGLGGGAGIVLGGILSDRLARRDPAGHVQLAGGALLLSVPVFWIAFSTHDLVVAICALFPAVMMSQSLAAPAYTAIHGVLDDGSRGFGVAAFLFIGNLFGIGLGALLVGALSDALTVHVGAEALRYALLAIVTLGLPGAIGFFSTGRALRAEWKG